MQRKEGQGLQKSPSPSAYGYPPAQHRPHSLGCSGQQQRASRPCSPWEKERVLAVSILSQTCVRNLRSSKREIVTLLRCFSIATANLLPNPSDLLHIAQQPSRQTENAGFTWTSQTQVVPGRRRLPRRVQVLPKSEAHCRPDTACTHARQGKQAVQWQCRHNTW